MNSSKNGRQKPKNSTNGSKKPSLKSTSPDINLGQDTVDLLHQCAKVLASTMPDIENVLLFGSRAQGFSTDFSDIDLCILVQEHIDSSKYGVKLSSKLGLAGINADVIAYTKKEFEKKSISPILHEIKRTCLDVTSFFR